MEAGPWVETCWLVDGLYVKCSGLDWTYVVGGPRACGGAAKVGMSSGRIVALADWIIGRSQHQP